MDHTEKKKILSVLGRREASGDEVREVTLLFQQLGGIERSGQLARLHVERAVPCLEAIPDSNYKRLLMLWADFMVNREF